MKRYQKQVILPEIGIEGQNKMANASVLIIGAGGLGVVVASYLAAMGIGSIGICDFDTIEESNLHRQFFYTPNEIGQKKATVLVTKLKQQNPTIRIKDFIQKVDEETILDIADEYQLICDCTDQGKSRISINNYCQKYEKTLIHGAVSDWQGYLTVFYHLKKVGLSDVFEFSDYLKSQSCTEIGVNSTVCGLIGSYMANETMKIILNLDNVLEGRILYINTLNNIFRVISIKTSANRPLKSIVG